MDNPETLTTFGTYDRGQKTQRNLKKWATGTPSKQGKQYLLLIRHPQYYTCSLDDDRGKRKT